MSDEIATSLYPDILRISFIILVIKLVDNGVGVFVKDVIGHSIVHNRGNYGRVGEGRKNPSFSTVTGKRRVRAFLTDLNVLNSDYSWESNMFFVTY